MMTYNEVEYGKSIPDFPNYEVTNFGRVYNIYTGREMKLSPTFHDDLTVGMMRHGIQYRRSVKVLVARAFLTGETKIFNTPILLDGNKHNLRATNIRWRPRWFATQYARQFWNIQPWYYDGPILDIVNNIEYESIFQAAITNGNLCKHIQAAIPSETYVFPTGEKYIYI
jgi:hypothetical protein